jgi:DNA mismatch repair ATPase MutS
MPLSSIRRWMLFLPVELFTLWNIHLLWLLERWQVAAGKEVRAWLLALGEFEALAALATLHHDHPLWRFPTLGSAEQAGQPQVKATNLAHPLLPPADAVGNDVTVGPPGSFLLVTGSNMSGKSTLLRAIGLNCVLAQMGAPVCAAHLQLPPVLVASSMRVQDSLSQGVSYFLAELQSLKAIVDLAEQKTSSERNARSEDVAPVLLYLLDEILQGTNSAERQIAARHVIQRLVASGAIGAVSTHDLTLAAAPELTAAAVAVHFSESFTPAADGATGHEPAMHFDYKLRPGVATSTNALKLMQLIGLSPLLR